MATVDIGSNSYEAFADADFADEYLAADILRADSWAILSDDNKGRALVSATRFLLALPWCAEAPSPSAEPSASAVANCSPSNIGITSSPCDACVKASVK